MPLSARTARRIRRGVVKALQDLPRGHDYGWTLAQTDPLTREAYGRIMQRSPVDRGR